MISFIEKLAWYLEAIGVKADAELGSVDKLWFVRVGWVFYWSILVFNGAVFVWYFGSGISSNWKSIDASSISNSWYDMFAFVFSYFGLNISEVYWVSFSLLSSVNGRYNVGSGDILVSKGTVNLFSVNVGAWLDSDSGSKNWGSISISSISIWVMEEYSWVSFTLLTACTWDWSSVSVVASVAKGIWMSQSISVSIAVPWIAFSKGSCCQGKECDKSFHVDEIRLNL